MKPMTSTITNTGTMNGQSTAMTISAENMAHLQSVLTNLYSDPVTAVIREYSTNAFDAHREIGLDRAIKVTLPTRLSPTFSVEDFGVGMSTDQLLGLYSEYGASTKRDTNEQTGMLGLGSKSGLAVTSQFTVRSRKGGVETTALIYLNDFGAGEIKIVDTRATSETGTLISIPVAADQIGPFQAKAEALFRFWPEGSVEGVNTSLVSPQVISDSITLVQANSLRGTRGYNRPTGVVVFVQGNVPYTYDRTKGNEHLNKVIDSLPLRQRDIIFYAPIGSLQFTPSREDLYYTKHTMNQIEKSVRDYHKTIGEFITKTIDKCATKAEAVEATQDWQDFIKGTTVTYKGEIVPNSVKTECFHVENRQRIIPTLMTYLPPVKQIKGYDSVVFDVPKAAVSDTGYRARNALSRAHGFSGVVDYYGSNSSNTRKALMFTGPLPENWDWMGVKAVSWDEFTAKTAGPKISLAQGRTEYQDRLWDEHSNWSTKVKVKNADGDGTIYITRSETGHVPPQITARFQVVSILDSQKAKFGREFPKALSKEQATALFADEVKGHLSSAASNYSERLISIIHNCGTLDTKKILDRELASVLELTQKGYSARAAYRTETAKYGLFLAYTEPPIDKQFDLRANNMIDAYGDILSHRQMSNDRKVEVINALYTYKHQGE